MDAFFDGSWQNALVDASEAAALAAAGGSPPSPPFATTGGVHNLVDRDDDIDFVPSPPGFDNQNDDDYHYVDDEDGDDAMLAAAVDETKDGMRPPPPRRRGRVGAETGTSTAPIMIDDEDEELQRAIDTSMGGASGRGKPRARRDHERDNRPPRSPAQDLNFGGGMGGFGGVGNGFGGAMGGGVGGAIGGGAGGAIGGGQMFGGAGPRNPQPRVEDDLPEGITAAEREEARMLEAAMLGVPYEGPVPDGPGGGLGVAGFGINTGVPASAEVQEARLIRSDTDWAYEESLRLDREKEEKRVKEEAEQQKQWEELAAKEAVEAVKAAEAAAQRDAAIALASDALPEEPPAGLENVVDVAVKLPDGRRVRRRFNKTDHLQAIFNFLVSDEHLEHGTYRLVSQFPRRSFEDRTQGNPTLEQAGLTEKQEALFVDLL